MWDDHENGYDMMNGSGAILGFGVLVLILLVVVLIAVLAHLHLRSDTGATAAPAVPAEREARRLLDRRLALGEITAEEYASIRAALEA